MQQLQSLVIMCSVFICGTEPFIFPKGHNDELLNRIDTERVPHNYPVNRVSELIQRHATFYAASFDDEHVTETESRLLGATDQSLCETTETIEIPSKLPRASDGRAMVIAQDYTNKVQQKIRYVRCKQMSGECTFKEFPHIYESYCQQQYSERKLYVYENDKITSEVFTTPTCCTCHLRYKSSKKK